MSQYRVFNNPETKVIESVKQGWSWAAFLFPVPWAFVKRMNLLAILTLLGVIVIGYAIGATQIEDKDGTIFTVLSLLLGLIFGANGNSWRERNLLKRGFVFNKTINRTPVRKFFAHPIVGLKTVWHDPVWSKVISGIILAIGTAVTAYFLFPHSANHLDTTKPHHSFVSRCKRATIIGRVEPNGEETFAWFEWGETPDLGNVTKQQRFTDETEYYQDLIDLNENTTYFYRVVVANINGKSEGRVNSFTTIPCER
jgi:hypothetical protein